MTTITTADYSFYAAISGNPDNEPVILLHGFPETSYMWRLLQQHLADNGFYSIAPDQRGYSPGARPNGKRHYTLSLLAEDVIAMADSLGLRKFHLIGHDWGSAVGWSVAFTHPERLLSWTAMSVPHLDAFAAAIANDPAQHKASGYMRMFRWPILPEVFLKSSSYRRLRELWIHSGPEEIEAYLSVFSQPGAISAALNWYRSNYEILTGGSPILGEVKVPTLFIWGKNDPAILRSGADSNSGYVSGSYTEYFIDAGHWLIQESFSDVSGPILDHLKKNGGR